MGIPRKKSEAKKGKSKRDKENTHKAKKMQTSIGVLGTLQRVEDIFYLFKFVLPDGLVDANDILPDNAPRTDIQVSKFEERVKDNV